MIRNNVAARTYEVIKEFVFRGLKYKPGDSFDPLKAQCVPAKLTNLIRQRYLGDDGPSLAKAIKHTQAPAPANEPPAEGNSDANSGTGEPPAAPEREGEPEGDKEQEASKPARPRRRS